MPHSLTTLLVVFVLALSMQARADQELEFKLKTYGMVCNQCAYGVEQALQHTDGVNDATVDLKSGSVVVKAEPTNPPSPEILAQRVRDQRLSIEKIEATLVGRIVRTSDQWQLVVGSRRFRLDASEGTPLDGYENETAVVDGVFEGIPGVDGASGSPRLILRAVNRSVGSHPVH